MIAPAEKTPTAPAALVEMPLPSLAKGPPTDAQARAKTLRRQRSVRLAKRLSVFVGVPTALAADVGLSSLSATRSPRPTWVAATTSPIPPSPRTRSTRYFPPRTSPL